MDDREARFEAMYAATYEPILGYVLRRCSSPDDAADIVAETFTIAWRRLDEIPAGDRARLWLYGVARRVLANHWRGEARRRRRTTSLREEIASVDADPVEASAIAEAFGGLSDDDRELLGLVAWEGLDHAAIAAVLGCSAGAARVRLHRARKRFSRALRSAQIESMPRGAKRPVSERSSLT
ncbi:sigma-70 family RNA polymerase sigma factor [Actinomadura sp. GC306]|uniref:RNA polymerase sigma factor n=1 Tax=Actinomadura sp. GC306 TaxID=2530367 RepID=UPI001043B94F|nr:sigma-70 family RNA polymerase sigma factor [Actinomadura sp. GC306]TDC67701.1 sigma-70 family RNA polymerase sigma factor [Actinomadura sp. GC306]